MLSYNISSMPARRQARRSSTDIPATAQVITPSAQQTMLSLPLASADAIVHAAMSTGNDPNDRRPEAERHVWLVTGPAGCGKSTVAEYLANALNMPYIEGDEFHPKANIDKMSNGIPLTDADRWDWLTALREESVRKLDAGNDGAVLTCSALKRKYGDVIRVAPYFVPNLRLHFIFLHAPEEVLLERVLGRKNHYMGANMVQSQFDILEPPAPDETDVISIDVSQTPDEVKATVLDRVLRTMGRLGK